MTWLSRLKKISGHTKHEATETTKTVSIVEKGVSVVFVAPILANAVKNEGDRTAANDPTPTTTVQVDLSAIAHTKGLPTPPADGVLIDIGTARPPGLTPALLAASLALDAQIQADGQFDNGDVNPDRWCWPHSTAMNGAELDLLAARLARFTDKGVSQGDAESLADKLVIRDRDSDDRALCLECRHMAGYGPASWRCGNWQAAGVAISQRASQLPGDLVFQLQRCPGFAPPQRTAP